MKCTSPLHPALIYITLLLVPLPVSSNSFPVQPTSHFLPVAHFPLEVLQIHCVEVLQVALYHRHYPAPNCTAGGSVDLYYSCRLHQYFTAAHSVECIIWNLFLSAEYIFKLVDK